MESGVNTVTITINGQAVKAAAGATVLEAALAADIYIPALCYHPDLEPYGGCRLCIVEIEGMRSLPTSCTTIVSEGMVVATESETLASVRRTTLELILSTHPCECLLCERRNAAAPMTSASGRLRLPTAA